MLDVFTKVVLAGACLFTFAWVILAQRRNFKRLTDAYLRLTHFQRVLVALAVIVCTVYAQKPSTNDVNGVSGTNDVEIVLGGDTNDVDVVEGGTNGVDVVEGGDTNGVEIVEGGETNGVDGTSGEAVSSPLVKESPIPLFIFTSHLLPNPNS